MKDAIVSRVRVYAGVLSGSCQILRVIPEVITTFYRKRLSPWIPLMCL